MIILGLLVGLDCYGTAYAEAISPVNAGVLDLEVLYDTGCNDWSQLKDMDKMKIYGVDSCEHIGAYIRAQFGDIEYIIGGWRESDDEIDNEYEFDYVATCDVKFELMGMRVGQSINVDSIKNIRPECVTEGRRADERKIKILSWHIVTHNNTIIRFCNRIPEWKSAGSNPKLLIDNVMLLNYKHTPTLPYFKKYIKDQKYMDRRNALREAINKKKSRARAALREKLLSAYIPGFGIMSVDALEADRNSALPDDRYEKCRRPKGVPLSLDSLVRHMPAEMCDISELQYPDQRLMYTFIDLGRRQTVTKPCIKATLKGIEYMLLLDYDRESDCVFVSKVITCDPGFELIGYKISGESPCIGACRENYELSEFNLYDKWSVHDRWKCVAADNKIIYFYKNRHVVLPREQRDGKNVYRASDIIDEVMLRQ